MSLSGRFACAQALLLGVWAYGQSRGSGIVEATRFVVVDEDGYLRGVFGMDESSGTPVLTILEKEGRPSVVVSIDEDDHLGASPSIALKGYERPIEGQEPVAAATREVRLTQAGWEVASIESKARLVGAAAQISFCDDDKVGTAIGYGHMVLGGAAPFIFVEYPDGSRVFLPSK